MQPILTVYFAAAIAITVALCVFARDRVEKEKEK